MKRFLIIILLAIVMGTACSAADRLASYDVDGGRFKSTAINYSAGSTSRVLSTVSANFILQTQGGYSTIIQDTGDTNGNVLTVNGTAGSTTLKNITSAVTCDSTTSASELYGFVSKLSNTNKDLTFCGYSIDITYGSAKDNVIGYEYKHDLDVPTGTWQKVFRTFVGQTSPVTVAGDISCIDSTVIADSSSHGNIFGTRHIITDDGDGNVYGAYIYATCSSGNAIGAEISVEGNSTIGLKVENLWSDSSHRPTTLYLYSEKASPGTGSPSAGLYGIYNNISYTGNDSGVTNDYGTVGELILHTINWSASGSAATINAGVVVDTTLGNSESIDYYSFCGIQDKALGANDSGIGQGFLYGRVDSTITGGTGSFYGLNFDMSKMNVTGGGDIESVKLHMPLHEQSVALHIKNSYTHTSPAPGGRGLYFDGRFNRAIDLGLWNNSNSIVLQFTYNGTTDITGCAVYAVGDGVVGLSDKDDADKIPLGIVVYQESGSTTSDVFVAVSGLALVSNAFIGGSTVGKCVYIGDDGHYTTTPPGSGDHVYPIGVILVVGNASHAIGDNSIIQVMPTAYTFNIGA